MAVPIKLFFGPCGQAHEKYFREISQLASYMKKSELSALLLCRIVLFQLLESYLQ